MRGVGDLRVLGEDRLQSLRVADRGFAEHASPTVAQRATQIGQNVVLSCFVELTMSGEFGRPSGRTRLFALRRSVWWPSMQRTARDRAGVHDRSYFLWRHRNQWSAALRIQPQQPFYFPKKCPPDRGTRLPQGIGDLTLVDQLIKRTVSSTTATASAAVGLASRANARNGLVGGSLLV